MKPVCSNRRSVIATLLQRCGRISWVLLFSILAADGALGQQTSPGELAELDALELPTEAATLLAIVGDNPILLGDLMPKVDGRIAQIANGNVAEIPPEQLKVIRLKMLRSLLVQTIQRKMLGHAFLMSQVGASSAEQRREAQIKMAAQARKAFYENELPRIMKETGAHSFQDIDIQLREQGSSLKALEHEYQDKMLGAVYIQKLIPRDPPVTLNELRQYYQAHRAEYDNPARARWEQLTVLFTNFPSKAEAHQAISEMGREAYYGGNLQKVAKEKSQGPLASGGGVHDWTRQGSLASKVLDEKIFSLPLNEMSRVIEDADGFHIIRVLDRKEAGVTPLAEIQDEIRKKIQSQKVAEAEKQLMIDIRRDVPVWSRYPQDVEGAMPLDRSTAASTATVSTESLPR